MSMGAVGGSQATKGPQITLDLSSKEGKQTIVQLASIFAQAEGGEAKAEGKKEGGGGLLGGLLGGGGDKGGGGGLLSAATGLLGGL